MKARNDTRLSVEAGRGLKPEARTHKSEVFRQRTMVACWLVWLSWLLLPVYIWQGLGVRRRTERLVPPPGAITGKIDGGPKTFSLLVIGDSSAASVGAESTEEGLAPNMARLIHNKTGNCVFWRSAGFNSATTRQLCDLAVVNLERFDWSLVVIAAATNDVKNFHSVRRFKSDFGELLYALKARYPQARLVWSPVVNMRQVPALPNILGWFLENRARKLNAMGRKLCHERGAVAAERLPITDPAGFARDGFHPSALAYKAWAEHLILLTPSLDTEGKP